MGASVTTPDTTAGLPGRLAPVPVDLGVGLAQVEDLELRRVHELLAHGPGVGQLDQGPGRRVRRADGPQLDPPVGGEGLGVADGAVADDEAVLARRHQLVRQVAG